MSPASIQQKAAEALREIRGLAGANRVRFTGHARRRMTERGAQVNDVLNALRNASRCTSDTDAPGRWKVFGEDLDGAELVAVVVIEDGVLVITVH